MDGKQNTGIEQAKQADSSSILRIEVKAWADSSETPQKGDFTAKLGRYGERVRRSRQFVDHLSKVDPERAEKLNQCGGWLYFRDYIHKNRIDLAGGLFCQQRLLCPFCASRIAGRRSSEVYDKLSHLLIEHRHLAPYSVTLTMRSMDDAAAMVAKFWKAWGGLMGRRRDSLGSRRSASVMGLMEGGFLSGEAKRGHGGGYHYHGHGIFLAPAEMRYKPVWESLKREWSRQVCQANSSIQFRPVYGSSATAVMECTKYAIKFDDASFDDRLTWWRALHRKRTFRTFGLMRGLKLSDKVTDDVTDLDEFVERVFSFNGASYEEAKRPERDSHFDRWNEAA